MAIGKHRSNKRSSGNSYTSVITVVFIAVCIIGVWMFTSNSFVSSKKTTRTTVFDHLTSESGDIPLKFPTTTPAFEDNPGDLPNDAIKLDENQDANEGQNSQSEDHNSSEEENPSVSTGNEEESVISNDTNDANETNDSNDTNDANETNDGNDNHEAGNGNNDEPKQDLDGENENKDPEQKATIVEENPHGLRGKVSAEEEEKLQEHHIQLSEESDMTHQQVKELIKVDNDQNEPMEKNPDTEGDQESNAENQEKDLESSASSNNMEVETQTDNNQSGEGKETIEDVKDHISDEEQETRMENQQQQEEDQSQGGETSEEQVQHDEEAPIDSHSIAEETKNQLESIEGQHSDNQDSQEKKEENSKNNSSSGESFAIGESSSEIPKESKESKKAWSTQADQSENQKEREGQDGGRSMEGQDDGSIYGYTWALCNEKAGADFIPCLDNEKAIAKLHGRNHYEHRERHCPEESPTCLVPLPQDYKTPIGWPQSRDKIWYHNVPHTTLADVKGHQNWVKLTGEFLTFPGGGTQFIHGALHYIDFVQEAVPEIAWGKHTRVVLDVGCGVASFGGYLFERGVLTMSLAPKDEHEAQVQFALERGIPAISAVMGTQRLQFPSRVFDLIHCARCRVPWHIEGGKLLLELNRLLRPGGYFVWSATPVYQTLEEDVKIWKEMSNLTVSMCWELVTIKKDKINSVGAAIYHKPESNECCEERKKNQPPMCKPDDDPNAAWYIPLQACMHRLPVEQTERGVQWPDEWPLRLQTPPYWLNKSQMGIYGKPAPDDFAADYEHWQRVVSKSYMKGLGISWSNVRNVMDMRAVYGGFAAALKDLKVWVMNVVNIDSPDTLPIIYERGLFGIYHDWCESFSTYPRTYDLLHADHLFSKLKKRCKLAPVMAEVDRIARPGGKLIVRDESVTVGEVENLLKSLHWEIHLTFSNNQEAMLSAQKTNWRPEA